MRPLPPGWPDLSDKVQTPPVVYLHVLDSAWPPASDGLDAGWAVCGSGKIDQDLTGSLLPGQVHGASGFVTATAEVTIPQPSSGMLAPWRTGSERIPAGGPCELIASYDGPEGSSAFLLGRFRLDPVSGKASEPFVSLSLAQDLVRFNGPHNVAAGMMGDSFSPSWLLAQSAGELGLAVDSSADFPASVVSSHFAGDATTLAVWQQIVTANLGAMWLGVDGNTLVIRDSDYLSGDGTITETLDVLDSLGDLSWTVDPGEVVDRVELTYMPAVLDDSAPLVWTAPQGVAIAPSESVVYTFDPGKPILSLYGNGTLAANTSKTGVGTVHALPASRVVSSSGRITMTVTNNQAVTVFLVNASGEPSTLVGDLADVGTDESKVTLSWGAAAEFALNPHAVDLGRNVQNAADAGFILDRIVARLSRPSTRVDEVRVVPNLGREIADLGRFEFPEADLSTKTIITKLSTSFSPEGVQQSVSVAFLPVIIADFNEAWDAAMPGATVADFNAFWAGKTIADFNHDPLATP